MESQSAKMPPPWIKRNKLLLLGIIFMDIVGFSLIFPLIPDLLDYYLHGAESVRTDSWVLPIFSTLTEFLSENVKTKNNQIIIFGGILSSIYSILQFIVAPYWGKLSDRIGRRMILIVSSTGLALSYLLWFFSSNFTVFFISRVLGGIMAGNMGVASASMADMSSQNDRTKEMGMIGAAIGLGFVVGPALGGLAAKINFLDIFPSSSYFHPYSFCSFISFLLSAGSAFFNFLFFRETLPPTGRKHQWISNPLKTIKTELNGTGMHRIFFMNFIFMLTFSGFEFTITFFYKLAFGLSPAEIGLIFLYLGVLIAAGQGGLVRYLSKKRVGEKKMALVGFALMPIPIYLMSTTAPVVAYSMLCLFPIAIGASLIQPSLSGLASLMAKAENQGVAMGVFRSSGSLARAVGPFGGAYMYWNFGIKTAYSVQAAAFTLVLLLSFKIKEVRKLNP